MKVENIISKRGNAIANQFIIEHEGKTWFRSYKSNIVMIDENGKIFIDEKYWQFSVTTSKYRAIFLGESTKETQEKIKTGEYTLTNLN